VKIKDTNTNLITLKMKMTNISKIGIATLVAATMSMTSCKKGCTDETATNYDAKAKKTDNTSCTYAAVVTGNTVVSGKITSNTTWTNDKIYELSGFVVVDNGATLTIEAGTIIKGQEGTGSNASALIVARGSKINAVGTASQPIIFTSVLDNIEMGQLTGSNLTKSDNGKWGGLILLGSAQISAADGDTEAQIEGIPATETFGTYGGSVNNDNSGTLSYISIRHGGSLIGAGNEINGLTLGGVGSGTVINNIEIVANQDDGVEFFGGTVDIDNILIAYQGDDGIDIDMNYSGTVNNFVVVHGNNNSDEALEIDGPEGSTNTTGLFTLTNGTIISDGTGSGAGADLKSKAQGTISNTSFAGYASKVLKLRASFNDTVACTDKSDAYLYLTQASPILNIDNSQIVSTGTLATAVSVYNGTVTLSANDVCTSSRETIAESAVTATGTTVVSAASTGATLSDFNWTWTHIKGEI
jgi:hypothetical protein